MTMDKRIDYIDSLKGFGGMLIAFYHITGLLGIANCRIPLINKVVKVLSDIGFVPVEMFFFLSGYLMIHHYSDKIKSLEFTEYMRRKVRAIYPFLLVSIGLCLLFIVFQGQWRNLNPYDLAYNFFLLQGGCFIGNGDFRIDLLGSGTWFLTPLFLSYVLFFYICKYKEEVAFGIYGAILILGMLGIKSGVNYPILNGYMLRGLSAFFGGACFGAIVKKYGTKVRKRTLFLGVLCVLFYAYVIVTGMYVQIHDFILITSLIFLPAVLVLIENISGFRKLLSFRILQRNGRLSV